MNATATASVPQALHADRATWDREVRSYLGVVLSTGKSPNTVSTYGHSLEAWARWRTDQGLSLDPEAATRREAQDWVAYLQATVKPGTGATRFANVVTFYRWMVGEWAILGDVRSSPFDHVKGIKADAPRVPVLTDAQVDAILDACKGTAFADLRDRALLALTLSAGLRRSEVASLLLEDVGDPQDRRVRVQEGKGNTDAIVPFGQVAADALRHYLRARARHRDADLPVTVGVRRDRQRTGLPLFLVDTGSGHRGMISSYTVANVLERRAIMAGVTNADGSRIHVHQLRHTFAHDLLADDVSEGDVMTLGRWKSRKVMDRYGADLREARAAAAYRDPLARQGRR